MLEQHGLKGARQRVITFDFYGMHFEEGLRFDLLFVSSRLRVNLPPGTPPQAGTGLTRRREKRERKKPRIKHAPITGPGVIKSG